MVTEKDVNNQFWDYCSEDNDLEAAGKQMALEESIMTVREEVFSDVKRMDKAAEMYTSDMFLQEYANDEERFIEIPRDNIQWCCEEFKRKVNAWIVFTISVLRRRVIYTVYPKQKSR
jgi:hypothetical protein